MYRGVWGGILTLVLDIYQEKYKKDPTSSLKNKLISLLKEIKQTGGLSTNKYKQLYPTSAVPPKFYGLPKRHKVGTPLRPIVSSMGSITYGVAKELAYIIKPLVHQSPHHLKNTQHSVQQLQGKRLEPGEVITSFDVKALYTSVPVPPAIQIVKQRLQQDPTLPQKTACPYHKLHPYWSSVLPTLTSSSRVSIMNKSKVQL